MKAGYKVLGLLACIVVIATIVVWRLVLPDDDANAMGGVGSPPKDAPAVNDGIASVTSAKKEWQKLDDPAADGWDSEVLNAAFKKQLDELSERIVSGELSAESLASIVATDFRGTHLVPTSLTGVFDSNGIQVRRGTPSKKLEFSGVAGLEESLQELRASLGSEDGKLRCKFKVIGIRADGEQAVSRQLGERTIGAAFGVDHRVASFRRGQRCQDRCRAG